MPDGGSEGAVREAVIEAATEAMSLPGEKGIVRALTRDDAERAVDAVILKVVEVVEEALREQYVLTTRTSQPRRVTFEEVVRRVGL